MKKFMTAGVMAIILTGCAGGTIGGLFPAPKIISGDMQGLQYTAPNGLFSVMAPVDEERGEWLYTEVHENDETHEDWSSRFVGFKTPYDYHYYTVEVVKFNQELTEEKREEIAADNITRVLETTANSLDAPANLLIESHLQCDSKRYSYNVIEQKVTSHKPSFNKYYLVSQSFVGDAFLMVISELNFTLRGAAAPLDQIKGMGFERHNDFVCSVEIK